MAMKKDVRLLIELIERKRKERRTKVAGLFAKSHIQICVRNPNCIKGFFMPRREMDFNSWLEENRRA